MSAPPVAGLCPMGCGYSLVLEADPIPRVLCANPTCPRPSAVDELLHDGRTDHVVTVHADGVTIRHPLRERLDEQLDDCTLLYVLTVLQRPPVPDGRYLVPVDDAGRPTAWHTIG